MPIVKYYTNFFNSLNDSAEWEIEFIDTEASEGGTIELYVSSGSVTIDLSGGANELLSGVFATRFSAELNVNIFAEDFVLELADSSEKRWVVKAYREGQVMFVGYVMPDECVWQDEGRPYRLKISAVDGFQLLQSFNYGPPVGKRTKYIIQQNATNSWSAYTETPLTAGLPPDVGWTLQSHVASKWGYLNAYGSNATTIYQREEIYSVDEPTGTGWIFITDGLWARALTVVDSTTSTTTDPTSHAVSYKFQNFFADPPEESLNETIRRALEIVDLQDHMNTVYYRVLSDVYHAAMGDLTGDPTTQLRPPSSEVFKEKTWNEVLNIITEHHGFRIYQSGGTFVVEQITARLNATPKWFEYDYTGALLSESTANPIHIIAQRTLSGGSTNFQAALRQHEIAFNIDDGNYLANSYWDSTAPNDQYLGIVVRDTDPNYIYANIRLRTISKFDAVTLASFSWLQRYRRTKHTYYFNIYMTLVNRETGVVFYLNVGDVEIGETGFEDPTGVAGSFSEIATNSTIEYTRSVAVNNDFPENPRITDAYLSFKALVAGTAGDQFDMYIGWKVSAFFDTDAEASALQDTDKHDFFAQSYNNTLYVRSLDGQQNKEVRKLYTARNALSNSRITKMEAKYGDALYHKLGLQVKGGDGKWYKTTEQWGRGAGPYNKSFLYLQASEVLSLRMTPKYIYNGTLYSADFTMSKLIQRNSLIYLPMKVSTIADSDAWRIEMIQISSTTPPAVNITDVFVDDAPLGGIGGPSGSNPDPIVPPKVLETNEALTSGLSYSECDITNTLEMNIASGEVVQIRNESTDEYLNVVLTAAITPTSTVMYFVAQLFTVSFPDGSPIVIQAENNPLGDQGLPYNFQDASWSGSSHKFPNYYQFPDPEQNSALTINSKIEIYKNGVQMYYKPSPSGPDQWGINFATRSVTFPIAFNNQRIKIKAR